MRQMLAVLFLVSLACSSASVHTGRTQDSSTPDFDVVIDQPDAPMTMRNQESVELRFLITVKNRTTSPWTIERIALQSMGGGAYSVPVRTRELGRVVAPGAEEQFEFWGTAELSGDPGLARAPITMRTTLYAKNDTGKRSEEFMQRINGRVAVTAR